MRRERRTVVLRPPREVPPADHILEDESDDRPRDVVHSRCRRDGARAGEDDREAVVVMECRADFN